MKFTSAELEHLSAQAILAAKHAGQYIAEFDRSKLAISNKQGGASKASQVVTQVDLACEAIIKQQLRSSCEQFDIALLSEETAEQTPVNEHPRLTTDYFWCIDPLDGTLPFIENHPGYAVSIALVARNGEPCIGVVYQPVTQTLYHAVNGQCFKNEVPWHPALGSDLSEQLTVFNDRSFSQHQLIREACEKLACNGLDFVTGSGAVINALNVLEHPPACYVKLPKHTPGGGSLWDFSASAAIVQAAGGWVSDIHGQPLDLNRADSTFMNHRGVIYASYPEIARGLIGC